MEQGMVLWVLEGITPVLESLIYFWFFGKLAGAKLIVIGMIGCMLSYLLLFWLIERNFIAQVEKEQMLQMQAMEEKKQQYYEGKKEAEQKVRRMYHDINKHIAALEAVQSKQMDDLQEYMGSIRAEMEEYAHLYHTGNEVVDCVLSEKEKDAKACGIDVKIMTEEYALEGLQTFALCTIFTNLLENAIEAARECEEGKREIAGKICKTESGVAICLKNSYRGKRLQKKGRMVTTKSDTSFHGLGLESVQCAVKKLDGRMNYGFENGTFSLLILI